MAYGDPSWDFTELRNRNGGVVQAHTVTEETAWVEGTDGVRRPSEVRTVDGSKRLHVGNVIVQTGQPDLYDVYDGAVFADMGYGEGVVADNASTVEEEEEEPVFEPSEHTATQVRKYLQRDDLSTEERERVETAERNGANRSSAFPA